MGGKWEATANKYRVSSEVLSIFKLTVVMDAQL